MKTWLSVVGMIGVAVYIIAGTIYTYGKPHTFGLALYIPWWAWVACGVGVTLYFLGLYWDKVFPPKNVRYGKMKNNRNPRKERGSA